MHACFPIPRCHFPGHRTGNKEPKQTAENTYHCNNERRIDEKVVVERVGKKVPSHEQRCHSSHSKGRDPCRKPTGLVNKLKSKDAEQFHNAASFCLLRLPICPAIVLK